MCAAQTTASRSGGSIASRTPAAIIGGRMRATGGVAGAGRSGTMAGEATGALFGVTGCVLATVGVRTTVCAEGFGPARNSKVKAAIITQTFRSRESRGPNRRQARCSARTASPCHIIAYSRVASVHFCSPSRHNLFSRDVRDTTATTRMLHACNRTFFVPPKVEFAAHMSGLCCGRGCHRLSPAQRIRRGPPKARPRQGVGARIEWLNSPPVW